MAERYPEGERRIVRATATSVSGGSWPLHLLTPEDAQFHCRHYQPRRQPQDPVDEGRYAQEGQQ